MNKPIPSVATLVRRVNHDLVGGNANSISYLLAKRTTLQQYSDVEEFAISERQDDAKDRKACEHHLMRVRSAIARELWSRQVFIGVSVIDELLFGAIISGESDPIAAVLRTITDNRLHSVGMVIYPVHSLGLLGVGLFHWATKSRVHFTAPEYGFALSPQTNSIDRTVELLHELRKEFGIHKTVPGDLIRHWHVSRAKWLESNPLLVVAVRNFPGGYYENQYLLLTKLRATMALIVMLAAIQPVASDERKFRIWSSSSINNFQTLDINHYIVMYNQPKGYRGMGGDCVPMLQKTPALTELADLGVELDPRYWRRYARISDSVFNTVQTVYEGYLSYRFSRELDSGEANVYRKLFESLSYFHRSFRESVQNWSGVISLAIAFEMILTDNYSRGVGDAIVRRTGLLLGGKRGVRAMVASVRQLYEARSQIVHAGSTSDDPELGAARRAFVLAFVELVERLQARHTPLPNADPIRELCGDSYVSDGGCATQA